uniref:Uncharacterized protein n=1 Tax=Faecalibaculum rodentium TaxID=1702221 RepID=A0A140DUI9_9FIRM|nr:hypothetical protein AALO17_11820 [Faecalibaculum rodentium]
MGAACRIPAATNKQACSGTGSGLPDRFAACGPWDGFENGRKE